MSESQGLPIKLKGECFVSNLNERSIELSFFLLGCVIITGGTRGVGLCYSHAAAQAGANLALIFRCVLLLT